MNNPLDHHLNHLPKVFVTGAAAGFNKETLFFGIQSGNVDHAFATSPSQFKHIATLLNKMLIAYETDYGTIDFNIDNGENNYPSDDNDPGIISPIQIGNI